MALFCRRIFRDFRVLNFAMYAPWEELELNPLDGELGFN